MRTPAILTLTLSSLLLPVLPGQDIWRRVAGTGSGEAWHSLAFDEARCELVRFGGMPDRIYPRAETWVFDGDRWQQREPQNAPPERARAGMTYDPRRRRLLLSGGESRGDTWEWDGVTWTRHAPSREPPPGPRSMAYDRTRGRTVAIVFTDVGTVETWEWDGVSWQQASTQAPVVWSLDYDLARGVVVGLAGDGLWEWSGAAWSRNTNFVLPARPSPDFELSYDRARRRTVIFQTNASVVEVFEWDGTALRNLTTPSGPPRRIGAATAYDPVRRRVVLSGGEFDRVGRSDTWEWDGSRWLEVGVAPSAGRPIGMTSDSARGRVVVFGAVPSDPGRALEPDTWEWDGARWERMAPAIRPPVAAGAMVYDPGRRTSLLFDGWRTFEWNGTNWFQRQPSISPSPRFGSVMVFDAQRGEAVLFGGALVSSGTPLADTWLWNGSSWRQASSASAPSARWQPAMAYDPIRGRSVLFGGVSSTGTMLADTWVWDGGSWTRANPGVSPPARAWHAITFDPSRGTVVLAGGYDGTAALGDAWTWD